MFYMIEVIFRKKWDKGRQMEGEKEEISSAFCAAEMFQMCTFPMLNSNLSRVALLDKMTPSFTRS